MARKQAWFDYTCFLSRRRIAALGDSDCDFFGDVPEFGPFLKHGPCDSIRGVSKMLNLLVSRFKSLQRFAYPTPVNLPIPSLA